MSTHKTFSPANPNAITKRNLLRYFGRWGRTKKDAFVRFGITSKTNGKENERLELRFNLILASLFRKKLVGEDSGLIYASVNGPNADEPVAEDFQ